MGLGLGGAVRCGAVRGGAVRCRAVWGGSVRCGAMRCGFLVAGVFSLRRGVSSLRDGAIAKRPSAVGYRDSHGERLQREARPAGTGEPLPRWDYKERRGCCGAFLVAETEA